MKNHRKRAAVLTLFLAVIFAFGIAGTHPTFAAETVGSGVHDIFTAKDNTPLEQFKARVLNRILYLDEEIDVSDLNIAPNDIKYTVYGNKLTGTYAAREIVRQNPFYSTIATTGSPEFTYKDNGCVATVKYTYHPVWKQEFVKKIIASYDEVMALIQPGDSDFAKILKIHDWIVKNVSYGMSTSCSDFAVGALGNRKAVCAGYAQCNQFLLSQVGIQSIYVAANTTKEPHAWNLVKLDGHWFHVDCTWDRGLGSTPNVNHTYFMLSDAEFDADGTHGDDWKDPAKGYPTNNLCSIENKFYKDNKDIATDEQIAANAITIKHVVDSTQAYQTNDREHWRTCPAGVTVGREKHTGNPCTVCGYSAVDTICTHKNAKAVSKVEPTCTKSGNKEYWSCPDCGKYFDSANCTKEIQKGSWNLDALGHDLAKVLAKSATFDNDGYSAYEKCNRCDKEFGKSVIPKIDADSIRVNETSCEYNGKAQTPGVTVKDTDGKALSEGTDYTLEYQNNVKPGTATVKITFTGKYTGTAERTFEIKCTHKNVKAVSKVEPTCTKSGNIEYWSCPDCGKYFDSANYSKEIQKGSWNLDALGHDLVNVPVKAATFENDGCTAYEKCNRCGKESEKSIIPKLTAKLSTTAYTYTGGTKTPSVICSGASGLTKDKDYTVTLPAGRKAVGKYVITVKGAGDKYTGSKTLTYVINPKGTGIKKPAAAKKAFTAKWSKQSAKMNKARITGYQVQYSLKSNFKSAKTVTAKSYTKTSKKISKLKAKKTYYVRVRTYMKSGKTTFYSTWSKVKSVKTK